MGQVNVYTEESSSRSHRHCAQEGESLKENQEQPSTGQDSPGEWCVCDWSQGYRYRVLKWVMEQGQCPLLLWRREDILMLRERLPTSVGFQLSNKVNVPSRLTRGK